jgi:MFS family permease
VINPNLPNPTEPRLTESHPTTLAVFGRPSYQRFLIGTFSASTGLWICELALIWVIQTQTRSSTAVGVFYAVVTVPFVAGALWGGALTDRFGPRPLMVAAATTWALVIAACAWLTYQDELTFGPILAIGVVLGACDVAWIVPIQILAPAAVEHELTSAAIGGFPLHYGFGRLVGGLGGGLLVTVSGPFLALEVAFVALVVAALVLLTVPYKQSPHAILATSDQGTQAAAIRWVLGSRMALTILLLAGLTSFLAFSYNALLPAVASRTLNWGSTGLGLLTAAGGIGILLTSPLTDRLGLRFGRAHLALGAVACTGVSLAVLGLSTNRLLSALACAGAAGLLMVFLSTASMMLQSLSPPAIRGRAISFLSLLFWGAIPLGAVAAGFVADMAGLRTVLLIFGFLSALLPVVVTLMKSDFAAVDVDRFGRSNVIPKNSQ